MKWMKWILFFNNVKEGWCVERFHYTFFLRTGEKCVVLTEIVELMQTATQRFDVLMQPNYSTRLKVHRKFNR